VRGAPWLLLLLATRLQAQGPGVQLGNFFNDPSFTSYRAGLSVAIVGPVGGELHGVFMDGSRPFGNLWGAGADLSLFRGGVAGPYLIGGFEGGFATQATDRTTWHSWSAGLGYEIPLFGALTIGAEGRVRWLEPGNAESVELGLRLGLHRLSRSSGDGSIRSMVPASTPTPNEVHAALVRDGVSEDRAVVVASVVETAIDVMGTPYRWGGTGEEGFDCSGLIYYAYGKHGVALPRRSAEQAREGRAIEKDLDALRPGDLLTFSTRGSGGSVTHVGLYVGEGRFIHSATGGVQLSVLSPEDLAGRWWWNRWVGARRVVE
jgi:cell wall-associated NlpC family hydrolase